MIRTSNRWALAHLVALALAAGSASATNGYYTHGLGTKSKGMAGAGSANAGETLVLASNPAGIAFIARRLDLGLGLFSPQRDYSTSPSLANGNCSPQGCAFTIGPNSLDSESELFAIPYIASSWALSDVDYLATAFYGRGGMNTRWVGARPRSIRALARARGRARSPGPTAAGPRAST
jgi:long-chain fatty acid transport protein